MDCGHDDEAKPPKTRQGRRGRTRGQQGQRPERNNISEASVLFVDVEFGNVSAIFLAASALTPTLCQTLSVDH